MTKGGLAESAQLLSKCLDTAGKAAKGNSKEFCNRNQSVKQERICCK